MTTPRPGDIVTTSTGCKYRLDKVRDDNIAELTDLTCGVQIIMHVRTLAVVEQHPGGRGGPK